MKLKPTFILPPHPSPRVCIQRKDLPHYESTKQYIAQRKFNGTHSVISIVNDKIGMWERRGNEMTLYKMPDSMKSCLLGLPIAKDRMLTVVGELMHTKAKSKVTDQQELTNTIILFDILVYGDPLKMNQMDRLKLLDDICGNPKVLEPAKFLGAARRALVVRETNESKLWLAENWLDEFQYHYDECCHDQLDKQGRDRYTEIEGLMLRRKDNVLNFTSKGIGDVNWLIRCRKEKKIWGAF